MMNFQSKLPNSGTTIFSVMSALAREHNAINLSQGFPDFACSENLLSLAEQYMKRGFNQYAPMQGVIQLRERIAEIIEKCYGKKYSPETEITVTAGATQAIYTAIATFIHNGDEVIIFEPAYDCYQPAIELHGGKAIAITLKFPEFKINWQEVESSITEKTKMIIINTPHNPSGSILDEQDLLDLQKLVKSKNILVLSDEVYEHMVFDNNKHESVARYPSLSEQSIIVSSFGKTVHTTGWKIGYLAAPKELMKEIQKVHQYLVFAVNHPFQLALADFLSEENNYLALKNFYSEKRDYFLKLTSASRLIPGKCRGTYFQLMDYSKISDEKDTDFAIRLTKEFKLASVPLSVFYNSGHDQKLLRFCFAKKNETLEKAAEIICRL